MNSVQLDTSISSKLIMLMSLIYSILHYFFILYSFYKGQICFLVSRKNNDYLYLIFKICKPRLGLIIVYFFIELSSVNLETEFSYCTVTVNRR